jgi:hypothetical protein
MMRRPRAYLIGSLMAGGQHMPTTASRIRATLSLITALAMVATIFAAPASAASPTACRVKNISTGVTKPSLQKAVKAAKAGHRLTLRGTCKGRTTFAKSLSVKGVRTAKSGAPTLDGKKLGTVVTVKKGAKVALRGLTIRGGGTVAASATQLEVDGGGIYNAGALVLKNVTVRNNTANQGAGAWNHGKLTLLGSTAFRGNTAHYGAGIYNYANDSQPDWNGILVMKEKSSIRGNNAVHSPDDGPGSGLGGGVMNDGAKLTMKGSSTIRKNTAVAGGGLYTIYRDGWSESGVVCGPGGNVYDNDAAPGGEDCKGLA